MSTRWKPEWDERYWFIIVNDTEISVSPTRWFNETEDKRLYGSGNCFKTREQAEAALENIKKVLLEAHDRSENEGDK